MSYGGAIRSLLLTSGIVCGALGVYIGSMKPPVQEQVRDLSPVPEPLTAAVNALQPSLAADYMALLDASYSLGAVPGPFSQSALLTSQFQQPERVPLDLLAQTEDPLSQPSPVPQTLTRQTLVRQAMRETLPADETDAMAGVPEPAVSSLVAAVPLPLPRPNTLATFDRRPEAKLATLQRSDAHNASATQPSFFERLFGKAETSGPAMAYAAPETGGITNIERVTRGANPAARYDAYTAVYDITARTVYLPDGTKLEAHSGLRERLDDPRYVNERMRGATPPHLYDLTLRESLFHGVQALRLTPVGGEGAIYGRTGLLAHTYMLGPNGDSNGCVSFRNYEAFLRAYRNGQIKRLAVVARLN